MAVDASGVYVTGRTNGALAQEAQGTDVFVRKYDASGTVVWTRQFESPGSDLVNGIAVNASGVYVAGEGGRYSTSGQLGVQIPFETAGQTSATIRVTVAGQTSVPRTFAIDALAPGTFTVTSDGRGTAAVLHQDGVTPVTAQNPAKPNEIVVFFATGLGVLSPPLGTGEPSAGNRTATPTVTIDGASAEILFSGAAPGFVGLNQINLRIPPNTRTAANVPVVLSVGGKQSNAVTMPVAP